MFRPSSTLRRRLLASAFLAGLLAVQATYAITTTSATFDESNYLAYVRDAYAHGNTGYWAEKGVAPLPLLLGYALAAARPAPFAAAITLARACAVILMGIPLVLLARWWIARETTEWIGTAAALWLALSPNIVAHAALATTDICLVAATIVALAALTAYVTAPSRATFAAAAAGLTLAVASKFSAMFLFGVAPLAWIVVRLRQGKTGPARVVLEAAGLTIAFFAIAFFAVWAMYGFAFAEANVVAVGWRTLPASIAGLMFQIAHQRGGHFAYLLGQLGTLGWWYYLPVALAVKSTPSELFVVIAGIAALFTGWRTATAGALVARIALVLFTAAAAFSRVDAGIRYVLLLYPLAAAIAAQTWLRQDSSVRRAVVVVLVLFQAVSAVRIAPHYVSYFNVFAGGPSEGYRYLADSNVDWGQDLPALRDTLARVGARNPRLAYFGTAPLEAYGVDAAPFGWGHPQEGEAYDWIAISATYLDGAYVGDSFRGFRALTPDARAAYSIFLYDARRPEVRAAVGDVLERQRH